ncbi:MAG: DUF4392 domain-containing protein [Nitrososphaerales archaeon]
MSEERRVMGEIVDSLIKVPVFIGSALAKRPVILDLYDAARNKFRDPLTYLASEKIINGAKQGRSVVFATGFLVPPWLAPETDGPVGAVTLARALNVSLDLTPIIITDDALVERISALCEASGFRVCEYIKASALPRRVAVEGFPISEEEALRQTKSLLDKTKPVALIAIERGSRNEKGEYHSGVGMNITNITAKIDFLFEEARRRGIPTIGIGDGGNEIGMGCIKEAVKKYIPTATKCGCPCGAGTHAATETDMLVVASVSNWGAYGIEACLAYALRQPELIHDAELEERLLEEAGRIGFIDPATGFGEPSVDHIPKKIQIAIIDILNFIVRSRLKESLYIQKYRSYTTSMRSSVQDIINKWEKYL